MAKRRYTDAEKTEALAIYAEQGPTAAQAATGISKGTVTKWAQAAGIETVASERNAKAVAAVKANHEVRKSALAEKLMQIAEAGAARELEVIGKSQLRDVVGARTRAIHDLQLLSGEATARTAHTEADQRKALNEGEDRGLRLVS